MKNIIKNSLLSALIALPACAIKKKNFELQSSKKCQDDLSACSKEERKFIDTVNLLVKNLQEPIEDSAFAFTKSPIFVENHAVIFMGEEHGNYEILLDNYRYIEKIVQPKDRILLEGETYGLKPFAHNLMQNLYAAYRKKMNESDVLDQVHYSDLKMATKRYLHVGELKIEKTFSTGWESKGWGQHTLLQRNTTMVNSLSDTLKQMGAEGQIFVIAGNAHIPVSHYNRGRNGLEEKAKQDPSNPQLANAIQSFPATISGFYVFAETDLLPTKFRDIVASTPCIHTFAVEHSSMYVLSKKLGLLRTPPFS